jgi:transcription regulator MmyB-like protein
MKSPEFAKLWAGHPVADCASGERDYHHPLVGPITLTQEILDIAGDSHTRLVLLNATPGTSSEAALRLLGTYAERAATSVE